LTAVARADGSSKFAPGNKWGYFPSGAAAWNMAKEEFMKEFTFLSDLKLKGSYGVSGNNRVSDFAYLAPVILSDVRKNYVFGSTYIKGAVQPTLGNSNLKWETTATTDIGLELSLFKRRIELEVDYYKKVTSNLLLQATTPGSIGYTSAMKNIGSVRNSGWEFSLNTINVTNKKFEWNSNFNISFNANKVLSLSSGQSALISTFPFDNGTSFPYIAQVGGPIAQIIGFKWIGNYQYADFDKLPTGAYVLKANIPAANGSARTAILPGDIKFEDINGDGILNDADKVVIGNPNPLFTGGFANNFTYRGFDLNVLMTFSYGNDILNANRQIFEGSRNVMQNQFATFVNRWTPENQTNLYPRAGGAQNAGISSRVVEDGSFLRLKTISLGYRIPQNILQRVNVKNMRIYCSAQNIAVWTNYQGSDPEVSVRPTALTPGFDFAAYPRSFSLTFGFNFSF
jgi:TonB-linked SusC/RagA family outer membrane protein